MGHNAEHHLVRSARNRQWSTVPIDSRYLHLCGVAHATVKLQTAVRDFAYQAACFQFGDCCQVGYLFARNDFVYFGGEVERISRIIR